MKKIKILIRLITIAVTLVITGFTSCKKKQCYNCTITITTNITPHGGASSPYITGYPTIRDSSSYKCDMTSKEIKSYEQSVTFEHTTLLYNWPHTGLVDSTCTHTCNCTPQ